MRRQLQQTGLDLSQFSLTQIRQRFICQWVSRLSQAAIAVCLVGLTGESGLAASNPTLKVGTVQRFGAQPTDRLTLKATPGDRLKLMFKTQNQLQTLNVESIELEVKPQSLAQPRLEERVVLSTHRSFETAEASAIYWREQGIAVEVAQPERWQVWAKRDQYNTPLLRRLLLQSLQEKGVDAFLDSQVLQQVPRTSWVANGFRYNRDVLSIYAGKNLIQVNQKLYAGSLRLQPNAYGSYTLVNQVPVETYLRGVVPHEIGRNAPESAIQAQVIIARTYALRNLRRFAIDGYELCADTQCQVYEGLNGTDPVSDRAIAATAGQVLTYNNELVDALYSSATGGVTAPFQDVWQGPEQPYLKTVIDAVPNQVWDLSRQSLADDQNFRAFIGLDQGFNEAEWPQFRWRIETTLAEITQTLQTYLQSHKNPLADFKAIQQIQVMERSTAGRVQKVQVQTDRGLIELVKDDILRGFDPPRSLLFYLEPLYLPDGKTLKGYAFVGGGLGHGVGLSQTGSYHLSRLGWSAAQILSFYYPGTQTQPLNQSIVFWQEKPASQSQPTTPTPDPVTQGVKAPPAELSR